MSENWVRRLKDVEERVSSLERDLSGLTFALGPEDLIDGYVVAWSDAYRTFVPRPVSGDGGVINPYLQEGDGIEITWGAWTSFIAVKLGSPSGLAFESSGLVLDDTVAGLGLEIANKVISIDLATNCGLVITSDELLMGTPGAVSVTSVSGVLLTTHTHAVTCSESPGAASSLLKTDDTGKLQVALLGVGVEPTQFHDDVDDFAIGAASGNHGMTIYGSGTCGIAFADGLSGTARYMGLVSYSHSTNKLHLSAGGGSFSHGWAVTSSYDFVPVVHRESDLGSSTLWVGEAWFDAIHAMTFKTVVFEADQVNVFNGSFMVAKSSASLAVAVTFEASGSDTFTANEEGRYAVGDFVMLKDSDSTTWLEVTGIGSDPEIEVTIKSGGGESYAAGTPIVNYGASGQGLILHTARDLTLGGVDWQAPCISVIDHAGEPWTALTEYVRLGNLNAWGGFEADKWGLGLGKYAANYPNFYVNASDGVLCLRIYTTEYIKFDYNAGSPTAQIVGDLVIDGGSVSVGTDVVLDGDGLTLAAGTGGVNQVKWDASGTTIAKIHAYTSGSDRWLYISAEDAASAEDFTQIVLAAAQHEGYESQVFIKAEDSEFWFTIANLVGTQLFEVYYNHGTGGWTEVNSSLRVEGGLYVGSVGTAPSDNDALIDGGLALVPGSTTTNPSAGSLYLTETINANYSAQDGANYTVLMMGRVGALSANNVRYYLIHASNYQDFRIVGYDGGSWFEPYSFDYSTGYTGIKDTTPADDLDVNGGVRADSYTEYSPMFTGDALAALRRIRCEGHPGADGWANVDHSTLPHRVSRRAVKRRWRDIVTGEIMPRSFAPYVGEDGQGVDPRYDQVETVLELRDLGAMVQMHQRAIIQLLEMIEEGGR